MGIYLIDHVLGHIHKNPLLIYRLPSIISFFCLMACMFSFIRKRSGDLIALLSASALLFTTAYAPFAFEARSYGPMLACISFALVCYDRIESKKWKWSVLFATSPAVACSMHFYASSWHSFLFGLAELTYIAKERKFRPRV